MGMPALRRYTAEMVRDLNAREPRHWPRYETVHGRLFVSPAPRLWHQEIACRLLVALNIYLDREPAGHAMISPADVSWGRRDILVQPDVFVVPRAEARTYDWRRIRHLLLAIEVLSRTSAHTDRVVKRTLYLEQGVPLYWIVDADARAVEVWTPGDAAPRTERNMITWHPAGAQTPFALSLAGLFQPI